MDSETVHNPVPYGSELLNEQLLPKGNPYILNDKISTAKILSAKISGLLDGLAMFSKASEQHPARCSTESEPSPSGTRGDGFPHIDRYLSSDNSRVGWKVPSVVKGIDSCAFEWFQGRQRLQGPLQQA